MRDVKFMKTTLIGGFFVLMPVVMVTMLVGKAFSLISNLGGAAATQVPEQLAGRLPMASILSVLFLVVLCYLLGHLVAPRTDLAEGTAVERAVLNRIPGYQLARGVAMGIAGLEGSKTVKPALLRREQGVAELVLMIEVLPGNRHVVFMPECPAPFTGPLLIVDDALLEVLPASTVAAVQVFSRWGGGTAALLAGTDAAMTKQKEGAST